jgi:inosose dehydratase
MSARSHECCSMAPRARLGVSPIAWTNDDLPQLGGDTPLATCLSDARDAGFVGTELGGKFPTDATLLAPLLADYGLRLVGGWYSGTLLDTDLEREQVRVRQQLELFAACGASVLVYGETAGTIQHRQDLPLMSRRRLTNAELLEYARKLTRFAEFCAGFGVPLAFHHHIGTAIEDEHDIDRLMDATGPAVGLLFDSGHLAFAGADPLRVLDRHGKRVVHVHAKDVRAGVLAAIDRSRDSFLGAVLKGVFTVPGDGAIDFDAIAARLAALDYNGWFIVEAEQDPAAAPPLEYARIGHGALTAALMRAGYAVEPRANVTPSR